jgi:uncharacterized membrane protein
MGQHTAARLAVHVKEVLNCVGLTNGCVLGISTHNASTNESMTQKRQLTLADSGIGWPALVNHLPCMVHVIPLALGVFMCSLGVNGRTKSWTAQECDHKFGMNEWIGIGKSQRLWIEGNAVINKVSSMRPGLAKIIEKVHILWYFENSETDLHIVEIACCIDYTET